MIMTFFTTSCHSDILVFLTGQEEIESMQRVLEKCRTVMQTGCLDLQVCTLFAALPTEQQRAAFTWTKKVHIRCIVCTGTVRNEGEVCEVWVRFTCVKPVHITTRTYSTCYCMCALLVNHKQ